MALQSKITKKIIAIVKPELAPLMKMLGVEEIFETDEDSVAELIKEIVKFSDIGVVITQKSLVDRVPGNILEDVQSKLYPIIVTLPDSIEDVKGSPMDVYRDIIRKFIGFELYIKF